MKWEVGGKLPGAQSSPDKVLRHEGRYSFTVEGALENSRTDSTDYWRDRGCVVVKCQCLGKLKSYRRVVP